MSRVGQGMGLLVLVAAAGGCGGGAGGGSSTAPVATVAQSSQIVAGVSGQSVQGGALSYSGLPAMLGTVSVPQ